MLSKDFGRRLRQFSITGTEEPASILGLLAVGAMGATSALKKKQASS
ncbi:PEP-CTERM sorting domain-containing protein [Coleofasciculus chthonoplastes]